MTFRLQGEASNRDAVGAKVVDRRRGPTPGLAAVGGGSYQSAGDPRLHFGLGNARRVDRLEVRWPSGRVDQHHDLAADTGYLVREGDVEAKPLKGW